MASVVAAVGRSEWGEPSEPTTEASLSSDELRTRFGSDFDVVGEPAAGSMGRVSQLVLYHRVRKAAVPEGAAT